MYNNRSESLLTWHPVFQTKITRGGSHQIVSFLWILFAKQEDKLCNPGANIPLVQHKGSYLLSAAVVFIGHVVRYTQMGKKLLSEFYIRI